ncbi:hypothetical protein BC937DRAFT_86614 [Endogone sp. FLAS-F59071]|nr:hypothetical protein BC937DRAFT_86614 [Endogone sp. FLAS-F59071]|eukprot:RUS12954.1 hypothetical protein BC937DRAFT_86614 [Endogone sp. FLAS-F59071]
MRIDLNPQFPHPDTNIFFYGTSRNILAMIDVRATPRAATPRVATATALPVSSSTGPAPTAVFIRNDAMINTLYVSRDGVHVTTGDSQGYLKVWDIRNRDSLATQIQANASSQFSTSPARRPSLTSLSAGGTDSPAAQWVRHLKERDDDDEPRYMAVNSYDNMMRVYDRGINPPTSPSRLVHALKGFKNKNWPIKSSFYCGLEYQPSIQRRPIPAHDDLYGDADTNLAVDASFSKEKPPERSVLLATGSADPYAYLYNVGEVSVSAFFVNSYNFRFHITIS